MSIKECLEAFVAHVQSLREEDEAGDDGYTKEFQMLKQQSNLYRMEGTFPTSEGERDYNRRKNRYKDILPFDYTRVILPPIPGIPGSDYINANFIKGATGENAYIASQGPLTHTVADFWRLIWYNKTNVVIMTANEYEGGKMKCACYWPKTPEERQYGEVSVTLMDEQERGSKDFIVRQFCAKKDGEVRIIHQLHYIAWPDHAVPASVKPLLEMVALARDIQPDYLPPLLIHCSAGCGRTGTLCAIDYAWTLLKMGQISPDLSLYDIIYEMRRQRPSSVQALDQYVLVHHAVAQLFLRHLDLINQHYKLNDSTPATPATTNHDTNTNTRTEESQYENIPSSFLDTSLDLPEVCVSAPTSLTEDHYANISVATNDVVQKSIRDTVAQLIRAASTSGLHLVPTVKPTEPLRYAPSPRIRARRNDVENGYAHIQLKHPLPIPRKSRMERNSSSSSSRSSTSSISSNQQPEVVREPIKSEPDYAVLSQFQSGEVPVGPSGAPIILQAESGEFMNTGTGPTKSKTGTHKKSRSGEHENPCIVFTSAGAGPPHAYENKETVSVSAATKDQQQAGSGNSPVPSADSSSCMIDSLEGELEPSQPSEQDSTMRPEHTGTIRPEHGTLPQQTTAEQRALAPSACSPYLSSQSDLPAELGHVKMEANPLYEDTQSLGGAPCLSFPESVHMEENLLYEQSSASVRQKWNDHRGSPHSPGSHDIPPTVNATSSSSTAHIPSCAAHPADSATAAAVAAAHQGRQAAPAPPKSPMISTDGTPSIAAAATSRSPDADVRRKPLPLPKPKTSPTSPDRNVTANQPSDVYSLVEKKTPTSSVSSSGSPGPGPGAYAYADPNALGKWSLQHVARNVPFGTMVEDGDYAQLKNPQRSPSTGQPAVPPRSTSTGQYEDVGGAGAYSSTGNGQRDSFSDDDSPQVPPKSSQDLYSSVYEPGTATGDDESMMGQMSRSLDTLSGSVMNNALTFGRKIKQKVQQTFGKTPGSPPEGLMLGSPPGTSSTDPQNNARGMAIFYKGVDISFPHRVPAPRGPRSQNSVTSPDSSSRTNARH